MKRILPLLLVIMAFGLACQNSADDQATKEYLIQYKDQKQPLKVDYTSPQGQVLTKQNKIVIHFTQPMVALGVLESKDSLDLVDITPKPKGYFKWVNTKTLVYQVKGDLSYATQYKITVKSGHESLLGFALIKDHEFEFQTPKPLVKSFYPASGSKQPTNLQPTLKVNLNQKIDTESFKEFVLLKDSSGNQISSLVSCHKNKKEDKNTSQCAYVDVKLKTPLVKGIDFSLVIKKGFAGIEGPLLSDADYTSNYKTYGDFNVSEISCPVGGCFPDASLKFKSTTGILSGDLEKFLVFEPAVKNIEKSEGYWSNYSGLYTLYTSLKPNTEYKLTLKAGLKDKYGQELKKDVHFEFKTQHNRPDFFFSYITDQVLNRSDKLNFGFQAINLESATAEFKTGLTDVELIELSSSSKGVLDFYDQEAKWDITKTLTGEVNDRKRLFSIPGAEVLQDKPFGIVVSQYKSPQIFTTNRKTKVKKLTSHWFLKQVTDLAIDTKLSKENGLVWVTSLNSGKAVSKAAVTVYNRGGKSLFKGFTNEKGLLSLPGSEELMHISKTKEKQSQKSRHYPFFIFAKKLGDRAFITTDWADGLGSYGYYYNDSSSDSEDGDAKPVQNKVEVRVHLLTDRGLYKPGEVVQIKGYLRKIGQKGLEPYTAALTAEVKPPRSKQTQKFVITPNERGNFDFSYHVPEHGGLGSYVVELSSKEDWVTLSPAYKYFSVQKFRTPEFKVSLKSAESDIIRGDKLNIKVSSEYLFGAPLKKAKLTYYISSNLTNFSPVNDKDWSFGRLWEHKEKDSEQFEALYAEDEVSLNDAGQFEISQSTKTTMLDPLSYSVEATVKDQSGQVQATRTLKIVHPAGFYLGGRLEKFFYQSGDKANVKFAALKPNGEYVLDLSVNARLMKVEWVSVKKETLNGQFETEVQRKVKEVELCQKKIETKESQCEFTMKDSGFYFVKLESKDKKGLPVVTELPVYVSGASYSFWPSEDGHNVEIIKDKPMYQKGDVAKILIKSPYENTHALIAIEREHVISYYTKKLEGSAPVIEVPIKESYAPNVFLSVVLIKGALETHKSHDKTSKFVTEALVKAGRINIEVSPYQKDLSVKIIPQKKIYKPGDQAIVDFEVEGSVNDEAELTVIVVDEGVLLAGGYNLVNPIKTFFAPYYHDVTQLDARIKYVSMQGLAEKGESPASGGGRSSSSRKKFIPLAYFNGSVVTKDGKAQVEFKVPDQLTTFKVMVIANSNVDKFGIGDGEFKTQKDLMIRPALPRFVRVGDEIKSKVVIHNNTSEKMVVTLEFEANELEMSSKKTDQITVPPLGEAVYDAKITAPKDSLTAKMNQKFQDGGSNASIMGLVRFSAKAKSFTDDVSISVPIYLERQEESVATSGVVSGVVSELVNKHKDAEAGYGELVVNLNANLSARLKSKVDQLVGYPYGCLEQRVSKIYPLLLFPKRNDLFSGDLKDKSLRFERINDFIQYLRVNQTYSGEFKLWPKSAVSPSLTLMLGRFLVLAKNGGHDVESLLKKLKPKLKTYLNKKHYSLKKYSGTYLMNLRANVLYLRYLLDEDNSSYYPEVRKQFHEYDFVTQARVVEMLHAYEDADPTVQTWLGELKNNLRVKGQTAYVERWGQTGYYLGLNSKVVTAQVLKTLLKVEPSHPFVFQMLVYLVDDKSTSRYRSSVESLEILRAMKVYQDVFPGADEPVNAALLMNGKELIRSKLTLKDPADKLSLPWVKLPQKMDLKIKNESQGILFYDLKYSYALKKYRKFGLEAGISYDRAYYDLDGNLVSRTDIRHGQTYKVVLSFFFADAVNYLAIEEMIPAGLEPLNFALKTTRRARLRNANNLKGTNLSRYLNHREFHDRKLVLFANAVPRGFFDFEYFVNVTNAGEYLVPPSKALEMYNPEIFGSTAASIVTAK